MTLPGLEFPAPPFLPPLKMGLFPLFQAVGTSLDRHNVLAMMGSGLAAPVPSGVRGAPHQPHGFVTFSFLGCSNPKFSLLSPVPALPSGCGWGTVCSLLGCAPPEPGEADPLISSIPSSLQGFVPWDCPSRFPKGPNLLLKSRIRSSLP